MTAMEENGWRGTLGVYEGMGSLLGGTLRGKALGRGRLVRVNPSQVGENMRGWSSRGIGGGPEGVGVSVGSFCLSGRPWELGGGFRVRPLPSGWGLGGPYPTSDCRGNAVNVLNLQACGVQNAALASCRGCVVAYLRCRWEGL